MDEDNIALGVVGGIGCLGCIGAIIQLVIYGAVATLLVWLVLYFTGVVENLPWQ